MAYDVEVPKQLLEVMLRRWSPEAVLRDDVLMWLRDHAIHYVRIHTWPTVDGVAMGLCFDDLKDAIHFKLRWF